MYDALGCAGVARVDFFLTDDGPVLNEVNTMPGFTEQSQVPKMFAAAGHVVRRPARPAGPGRAGGSHVPTRASRMSRRIAEPGGARHGCHAAVSGAVREWQDWCLGVLDDPGRARDSAPTTVSAAVAGPQAVSLVVRRALAVAAGLSRHCPDWPWPWSG